MPDWFINLIVQYPIALLSGLIAWYAWKQVRVKEKDLQAAIEERESRLAARADELRRELRTAAEAEIQRFRDAMREASDAHLKSKDAEIDRLSRLLVEELQKLAEKVDEAIRQ